MILEHIKDLVKHDFLAVNELVINNLTTKIGLIDELCHHIIDSGGKRLRPLMLLLSAKACGYDQSQHIVLAAAIEYFHTATLLHDDVVDESKLRRGQETANEIWGSKASVLVGDYLFTEAFQLLVSCKNFEILQLFADISHQISCGELKQLNNKHNINITLEDYFEVIRSKTALLFSASAELGARISNCNTEIYKALGDYGLHLGNAFQLVDDALDYCSSAEAIGKNIGDDLAEGKPTLPLIHALHHASATEQEFIKKSIARGTLEFLPEILVAINNTQAIEYTYKIAAAEIEKAITAINILPNSSYKQGLISLAQFAVSRKH